MISPDILERYRVARSGEFSLAKHPPDDTGELKLDKAEAKKLLRRGAKRLAKLQDRLYSDNSWALLVIFQGIDASGKDSAIKQVMSGVNPQGCEVTSFKAPSSQELHHDFLWRTSVRVPERGRIGIFNRSYYEEVLVVRVHPELLKKQNLPPQLVREEVWKERFDSIVAFERHLERNGVAVLKFFLNVSKEEQRERFLARIDNPDKHWKFSIADVDERKHWDAYMAAYEDMIQHTASPEAPWYVVPADHKRFARLVISTVIVQRLEQLDLRLPAIEERALRDMQAAREALLAEGRARTAAVPARQVPPPKKRKRGAKKSKTGRSKLDGASARSKEGRQARPRAAST